MANIFLSYSQEDREFAERIAVILEAAGLSVWDYRQIAPGDSYEEAIERVLMRADQVVVLWSPHSLASKWVRREALRAHDQGTLLQVLIGVSAPPSVMPDANCLDLTGWDGGPESPAAKTLVKALRDNLGWAGAAPAMPPAAAPDRTVASPPPPPSAAPKTVPLGTPSGVGRAVGAAVDAVAAGAAGIVISAGKAIRAIGRSFSTRDSSAEPPASAPEAASDRGIALGQAESLPREGDFPDDTLTMTGAAAPALDAPPAPAPAPVSAPQNDQPAHSTEAPDAEPVMLAVAAPRHARPALSFTASFSAYVAAARAAAEQHLKDLGEAGDRVVMDLAPDRQPRWRTGAPVTVRLSGAHLQISPAERNFDWNGRENTVTFAVTVDGNAPAARVQLCFQVFLGPVEISAINIGLELDAGAAAAPASATSLPAPSSAFASYSSKDAALVTQRLSTLAHWAPTLDIFQDCLDLVPNEDFKPQLAIQIAARDVFLLFWSRNAMASPWVRWELDTARTNPGIAAILPMPLEDPAIAPPPPGFEEKHLRDRYLTAGYGLAKIAETAAASRS